MSTTFTNRHYDAIREGCLRSATAVVPLVLDRAGPVASVVDVGCGEGWWGETFRLAGVERVRGFDGGQRREAVGFPITPADLTKKIPTDETFDLAVCLEVAEHLPASKARHLVAELCRLAGTVLFSAAMPRQGGTGHINCQPPGYWVDLFGEQGFGCDGSIRFDVWDDPSVEPWYKSNMMICTEGTIGETVHHVIHPDLYLAKR